MMSEAGGKWPIIRPNGRLSGFTGWYRPPSIIREQNTDTLSAWRIFHSLPLVLSSQLHRNRIQWRELSTRGFWCYRFG